METRDKEYLELKIKHLEDTIKIQNALHKEAESDLRKEYEAAFEGYMNSAKFYENKTKELLRLFKALITIDENSSELLTEFSRNLYQERFAKLKFEPELVNYSDNVDLELLTKII